MTIDVIGLVYYYALAYVINIKDLFFFSRNVDVVLFVVYGKR